MASLYTFPLYPDCLLLPLRHEDREKRTMFIMMMMHSSCHFADHHAAPKTNNAHVTLAAFGPTWS